MNEKASAPEAAGRSLVGFSGGFQSAPELFSGMKKVYGSCREQNEGEGYAENEYKGYDERKSGKTVVIFCGSADAGESVPTDVYDGGYDHRGKGRRRGGACVKIGRASCRERV